MVIGQLDESTMIDVPRLNEHENPRRLHLFCLRTFPRPQFNQLSFFHEICQALDVVFLCVCFFLDTTRISIRECVRRSGRRAVSCLSESSNFAFLSDHNFVVALDKAKSPAGSIFWSCILVILFRLKDGYRQFHLFNMREMSLF